MQAFILPSILVIGYALAAANAVIYPGVVSNNLAGFDTRWLALILPILTYILIPHSRQKTGLLKVFWRIHHTILLPLLLVSAALTTLIETATYENFVFSQFHLDYEWLFYAAITASAVFVTAQTRAWHAKYWKFEVFVLQLFIPLCIQVLYLAHEDLHRTIVQEDSLIENLQIILLLISAVLSGFIARSIWRINKYISLVFWIASAFLFLVTAEEISWGQRIFDIETPEDILENNLQGEMNIHNNSAFFGYVYRAYMLSGLLGVVTAIVRPWLLKTFKKAAPVAQLFLPGWQYLPGFFVAFLYNLDRFYLRPFRIEEVIWEEPMELLLMLSIALFLLELYITSRSNVASSK